MMHVPSEGRDGLLVSACRLDARTDAQLAKKLSVAKGSFHQPAVPHCCFAGLYLYSVVETQ